MDYDPLLGPRVSGSWADLNVEIWPEYNPFWKGRVEFHLLGSLQAELTRFPPLKSQVGKSENTNVTKRKA